MRGLDLEPGVQIADEVDDNGLALGTVPPHSDRRDGEALQKCQADTQIPGGLYWTETRRSDR